MADIIVLFYWLNIKIYPYVNRVIMMLRFWENLMLIQGADVIAKHRTNVCQLSSS